MPTDELKAQIAARLQELPKPVQEAITSADVQANLRKLSDSHKLHLDQWQTFENEVILALLGFQNVEDLEKNIQEHVGVPANVAQQLATDVSAIVFLPIRNALENQLEHPAAQPETKSSAEIVREQALAAAATEETPAAQPTTPPAPVAPAVQPATPPAPAPDIKVTRPSESTEYRPGQASHERKSIADDPYRESPV